MKEQTFIVNCPHCKNNIVVFNLSFSALKCVHCLQVFYRTPIKYTIENDGKTIKRTTSCQKYLIEKIIGTNEYCIFEKKEVVSGLVYKYQILRGSNSDALIFNKLQDAFNYVSNELNYGIKSFRIEKTKRQSISDDEVAEFCSGLSGVTKHGKRCQIRLNLDVSTVQKMLLLADDLNCTLNQVALNLINGQFND